MPESRRTIFLAGLLLVLAGVAAYSNSLGGEFIYDDLSSISRNPSIQHGWREALAPPNEGQTVMGRPLINLSFVFNYWLGGLNPVGYHALNIAIHLLAGLVLFGLVRRTFQRPALQARFGESSLPLAWVIALLWTLHPLESGCVSYIVQRAESLASLCYLLTLYFFVRGVESARFSWWYGCSLFACLLGAFSKEVIATAPLVVLLYDRTFVAGTFREAWRRRWRFYIALACTWAPLLWLIVTAQGHFVVSTLGATQLSGAPGPSPTEIWWGYLLKQCEAMVLYLRLAFWPHPLILEYGSGLITNPLEVAPQILLLALLLAMTGWALVRRPALGFLGVWFFLMLAPTSSVIPLLNDTMAERRMYLALAPVLVLAVLGLHALFRQRSLPWALALAVGFGGLTFERNRDYSSGEGMKHQLVLNRPGFYAENILGMALDEMGRREKALIHYQKAAQLNPASLDSHNNLANELVALGRWPEAQKEFLRALQLHPTDSLIHYNYGVALLNHGGLNEASREFADSLRIDANLAEAHLDYGVTLLALGRTEEALRQLEESLRLKPGLAAAHKNIGFALALNGQPGLALPHARAGVRLAPNDPAMHFLLGNILLHFGEAAPAEAEYRRALELRPEYFEAQNNLGNALLAQNRIDDALAVYAQAIKLKSDDAPVQYNYASLLARVGRMQEAVAHYEETLRLQPDYPEAHNDLGSALTILGRLPEAALQYQEALRQRPDYALARKNLEALNAALAAGPGRN